MIRTFLAVELSEPLRTHLATIQADLKQRMANALTRNVSISWVRPACLHVTVKFLGDIDEGLVLPLKEAITELLSAHRPIAVPVTRLGVSAPATAESPVGRAFRTMGERGGCGAIGRAPSCD
jgi:2'-5' RNA ligase